MKEINITREYYMWIDCNEDQIHRCPYCQSLGIVRGDNYCCNCGIKLDWTKYND